MSHQLVANSYHIPLDMLDAVDASPLDDRLAAYWGCDPFELIALIEEETGVAFFFLDNGGTP